MSTTGVHNARLMTISYAGKTLDGLKQDSFLGFTPTGDLVSYGTGLYGEVAPSILSDRGGEVTIKTMSQSPVNKYLIGMVSELYDNANLIAAPLYVKGDSGGVIYYKFNNCMIKQRPPLDIGNDMADSEVEWVFHCSEAVPVPLDEFELSVGVRADIEGSLSLAIDFSLVKAL